MKVWTADAKGYGSVAAGARAAARDAVHDEKRRGEGADRAAAAAAEASRWDAWRAL